MKFFYKGKIIVLGSLLTFIKSTDFLSFYKRKSFYEGKMKVFETKTVVFMLNILDVGQ